MPGRGADIHGVAKLVAPDSYRAWFANLFAAVPDMAFEVEDVITEGDKAAVRWRAKGRFTGQAKLEGFDANGAEIEMVGVDLLTVQDGKLVDLQAYTNSMDLARQLGAMPAKGSAAERAMAAGFNLKTRLARALKRD